MRLLVLYCTLVLVVEEEEEEESISTMVLHSYRQFASQPSPFTLLPSSHSSIESHDTQLTQFSLILHR